MPVQLKKNKDDAQQKDSVYVMVTKRILENMMKGELPWRQTFFPKKGEKPPYTNFVTGKPYSFLNCLLLGDPGEYASWKQIKERGGTVNKGAKSKLVIYWGEYIPKENKEKAKELEEAGESFEHLKVKFPKYYLVFNVKDTEGLKKAEPETAEPVMSEAEDPTGLANMVIRDYREGKQVAFKEDDYTQPSYSVLDDTVSVPGKCRFAIEEDWFASVFGQFVHSTITPERCNREKEYQKLLEGVMSVKEELIAEIGSSMILTACGLKRQETHEQLDAECQKWIHAMSNDYRLIVTSSYAAEKAAKYVLGRFAD